MTREFRSLSTKQRVDLIQYVKEYLFNTDNVQILIGCDSQNKMRETVYALVLGLYRPGKGAHVLYSKFTVPREKDNTLRLLNEVWYSVELAEKLKNELGIIAQWIDIDLNPDPKYKSNQALASAVGVVTGMGYNVRHKGNSPIMTYAADNLCKK
jgi:predicted RNase H-related nuclease YkuK (DUF458 family)